MAPASATPSKAAATLDDIPRHMNNGLQVSHKHLRLAQMQLAVQPVVPDWPNKLGLAEQRAVLANKNVANFIQRFNYPPHLDHPAHTGA